NVAQDLIGVPIFSQAASYTYGQVVYQSGQLYMAIATVAAGTFNPAQWSPIGGALNGGGAGRLTYVSATALAFKPFNGNYIKLNRILRQIPTAGLSGLANTGVFVGGVAAQNLAANTTYFVFAFDNSGVLTADFWAKTPTTYGPSTVVGNE